MVLVLVHHDEPTATTVDMPTAAAQVVESDHLMVALFGLALLLGGMMVLVLLLLLLVAVIALHGVVCGGGGRLLQPDLLLALSMRGRFLLQRCGGLL